jgi:hypothetical protein
MLNFDIKNNSQLFGKGLLLIAIICLWGCGKNENGTLESAQAADYFPLQIGKTWVYNLDSIKYDIQNDKSVKIDTVRLQVREVLVDTFTDATGQKRYKIERSEKLRTAAAWNLSDIFSTSIQKDIVLRTEGSFTYIKMPKVLTVGATWDGNVYNDPAIKIEIEGEILEPFSKKWSFEVLSFNKSEKIGNVTYDNVLTIEAQTDPKILTERRYMIEKYAKGIGLVYKDMKVLDTQKLDATIAWEKKAEKGFNIIQNISN